MRPIGEVPTRYHVDLEVADREGVLAAIASEFARHGVSIAATALGWLRAQPTVAAPIASASRVGQVADLLDGARVELTADELAELDRVSSWTPATV